MNPLSNLSTLIKENKLTEAKTILDGILAKPLSDKERGEALVKLAMIYVEVKNSIDREFLKSFKETMDAVKSINIVQQKIKDQRKLEEVRGNLSQS